MTQPGATWKASMKLRTVRHEHAWKGQVQPVAPAGSDGKRVAWLVGDFYRDTRAVVGVRVDEVKGMKMSNEHMQTIEINGVKMEVDMRHAKRVDHIRVGDMVSVLIKGYGDDYKTHKGVVVGFEQFEKLPTIIVAYVDGSWSEADIKFKGVNAQTKDVEIVKAHDELLDIEQEKVVGIFDRKIAKAELEVADLKAKREYFLKHFHSYWQQPETMDA